MKEEKFFYQTVKKRKEKKSENFLCNFKVKALIINTRPTFVSTKKA